MAAINCNTITGTQHPAPCTPPTTAKLLHTSDPTSTSLMIRKTDQWKCSLVDENPCCLCTHAHYWPWGHPLVKVWPGGGWWLGWCSSLPLSGFIASLQPGPRAALQHCSTAVCCSLHSHMPAQGVMNTLTLSCPLFYPLRLFSHSYINFSTTRTSKLAAGRIAVLYWLCIWIFPASIDHSPNMDHKLTTITAQ